MEGCLVIRSFLCYQSEVSKSSICVHRKWNVLSKLVIPRINVTMRYINSELEEIEREDNFRLKRFKELKIKRNKEKEDAKAGDKKGKQYCTCVSSKNRDVEVNEDTGYVTAISSSPIKASSQRKVDFQTNVGAKGDTKYKPTEGVRTPIRQYPESKQFKLSDTNIKVSTYLYKPTENSEPITISQHSECKQIEFLSNEVDEECECKPLTETDFKVSLHLCKPLEKIKPIETTYNSLERLDTGGYSRSNKQLNKSNIKESANSCMQQNTFDIKETTCSCVMSKKPDIEEPTCSCNTKKNPDYEKHTCSSSIQKKSTLTLTFSCKLLQETRSVPNYNIEMKLDFQEPPRYKTLNISQSEGIGPNCTHDKKPTIEDTVCSCKIHNKQDIQEPTCSCFTHTQKKPDIKEFTCSCYTQKIPDIEEFICNCNLLKKLDYIRPDCSCKIQEKPDTETSVNCYKTLMKPNIDKGDCWGYNSYKQLNTNKAASCCELKKKSETGKPLEKQTCSCITIQKLWIMDKVLKKADVDCICKTQKQPNAKKSVSSSNLQKKLDHGNSVCSCKILEKLWIMDSVLKKIDPNDPNCSCKTQKQTDTMKTVCSFNLKEQSGYQKPASSYKPLEKLWVMDKVLKKLENYCSCKTKKQPNTKKSGCSCKLHIESVTEPDCSCKSQKKVNSQKSVECCKTIMKTNIKDSLSSEPDCNSKKSNIKETVSECKIQGHSITEGQGKNYTEKPICICSSLKKLGVESVNCCNIQKNFESNCKLRNEPTDNCKVQSVDDMDNIKMSNILELVYSYTQLKTPANKESLIIDDRTTQTNYSNFCPTCKTENQNRGDKSLSSCQPSKELGYGNDKKSSMCKKIIDSTGICCKKPTENQSCVIVTESDGTHCAELIFKSDSNKSLCCKPVKTKIKVSFQDKEIQTGSECGLTCTGIISANGNMQCSVGVTEYNRTFKEIEKYSRKADKDGNICENHRTKRIETEKKIIGDPQIFKKSKENTRKCLFNKDPLSKPYEICKNDSSITTIVSRSMSVTSADLSQPISARELLVREVNLNSVDKNSKCSTRSNTSYSKKESAKSAPSTATSYVKSTTMPTTSYKVKIITKSGDLQQDNKESKINLTPSTSNIIKMFLMGLSKLSNTNNQRESENVCCKSTKSSDFNNKHSETENVCCELNKLHDSNNKHSKNKIVCCEFNKLDDPSNRYNETSKQPQISLCSCKDTSQHTCKCSSHKETNQIKISQNALPKSCSFGKHNKKPEFCCKQSQSLPETSSCTCTIIAPKSKEHSCPIIKSSFCKVCKETKDIKSPCSKVQKSHSETDMFKCKAEYEYRPCVPKRSMERMENKESDECSCKSKRSMDSIPDSLRICPTCNQKLSNRSLSESLRQESCGSHNSRRLSVSPPSRAKSCSCTSNNQEISSRSLSESLLHENCCSHKSCRHPDSSPTITKSCSCTSKSPSFIYCTNYNNSCPARTTCQSDETICTNCLTKKDASTSTRRSDKYDVRNLRLLAVVKKPTKPCLCKSDSVIIKAYKTPKLLDNPVNRSRSHGYCNDYHYRCYS